MNRQSYSPVMSNTLKLLFPTPLAVVDGATVGVGELRLKALMMKPLYVIPANEGILFPLRFWTPILLGATACFGALLSNPLALGLRMCFRGTTAKIK